MNDQTARDNLKIYFSQRKLSLNAPAQHDPKLGQLVRFFDEADIDSMLPQQIMLHIEHLQHAINTHTLPLWSLNLASYIQQWLMGPLCNELSIDLAEELSPFYISLTREACTNQGLHRELLEHSLCRGFESKLLQQFFKWNASREAITTIQTTLMPLSYYDTRQLHEMRIKALKEQLKLDELNTEHAEFWQQQTHKGIFNLGGKSIQPNFTKACKIPKGVYTMMKINTLMGYDNYLKELKSFTDAKKQKLFHPFRSTVTEQLYQEPELEYCHVGLN